MDLARRISDMFFDKNESWSAPFGAGFLSGLNQQAAKFVNHAGQIDGVCFQDPQRMTAMTFILQLSDPLVKGI